VPPLGREEYPRCQEPAHLLAALLPLGPFHGAGRQRSVERSTAAQKRRKEAAALAELLVMGGLGGNEVYLAPAEIADSVLALDDSDLRDVLGRPRRAWAGYPDHAHLLKTRIGREYALFAEEHGIDAVTQVVIRPPVSTFPLEDLAAWHAQTSEKLGDKLRYARKTRAQGFRWDVVSAEIQNAGSGGWTIDGHFHLTIRGADSAALERIQEYFETGGWSFWFTPDDDAGDHPCALVQYIAKGLADALGDKRTWRPDALAELRRQTRDLALTRATGDFRLWKAKVARAGLTAIEDDAGRPTLAPRRVVGERLRRKLSQSTSVVVLRLCVHDFGDGLLRRSIRVRGKVAATLADVAAAYNLSGLTTLSKRNTAIPKSLSSSTPSVNPLAQPNVVASNPPTSDGGDIPWRPSPALPKSFRHSPSSSSKRYTLARPIPNDLAIADAPMPSARKRRISSASMVDLRPL